jgi:DNA modification methylase
MRAPYLDDGDVRLYHGDVVDVLREMPDESVQTCVTSPPYWGLRDYGEPGQIGLEPTPQEYVAAMVGVFREVRRVLRDDGTLWLNLGDSYAGSGKGAWGSDEAREANRHKTKEAYIPTRAESPLAGKTPEGLKPKDLVGIPWRVAFALQYDGWWLRSDIIWNKPNPMPESVTDRPTRSHEYLFLLTKSARYFYDHKAVQEPLKSSSADYLRAGKSVRENHALGSVAGRPLGAKSFATFPDGRNARSVWDIATRSYAGAHFATFPPEIPARCIKAGTAHGDVVLDPFSGAATTALIARKLGRRAIGIELNTEYLDLSAERLQQLSLLSEAAS